MSGARERLAQALFEIDIDVDHPGGLSGRSYDDVAESLLPVVQALVAEGVQAELEKLAVRPARRKKPCPRCGAANGGAGIAGHYDRCIQPARADALRATASGEGTTKLRTSVPDSVARWDPA